MKAKTIRIVHIVFLFLALDTAIGYTQEISLKNTSRYEGGIWYWTIYLDAPTQIVDTIQYVDYVLYLSSTRPTSIRISERGSSSYPWSYSGQSKGYFKIEATVKLGTGQFRELSHTLTLNTPAPSQELRIQADNVARSIRQGWWSWTVYITADENVLRQVQCVEYTLHPTFQDPVRVICNRGTGPQAFPLSAFGWGTFMINIRVFLNNGQIQILSHYLRFN